MVHITELLPDSPHLDWVVRHHHAQWGYLHENASEDQRRALILDHEIGGDPIPKMYLATLEGRPVATAAIVHSDLTHRPDLSPWLASVYTDADFRGRGVGTRMVEHIMHIAANLKIPDLYLFTPDAQNFYRRLGWIDVEEDTCHAQPAFIMKWSSASRA